MSLRSITSSLVGKLTIYIVLLALFTTLASTAMLLFQSYQNHMKLLTANFVLIEDSYLGSLIDNIWVYNDKQIGIQLAGMLGLSGVEKVSINVDDKVTWAAGTITSDRTLGKVLELIYEDGSRHESLGALHITIGLDQVDKELFSGIRVALATSAVTVFFTAGFIWLLFRNLIARHMARVVKFINSIDMEQAGVELSLNRPFKPGKSKDELDMVVTAINNMRMKIRQSITEIRRSEKYLEAKSKELEQVVFVISHDLRSPLVNIDGYSKELDAAFRELQSALESDRTPTEMLATANQLLEHDISDALYFIRASTSKMEALLSGLLKVSRSTRTTLVIDSLDMNKLMATVVDSSKFQIKEAGAELDIGELPPCMGAAVQMNQVFSNLLGNALKYFDPKRPGVIRISGKVEGENVVYCVEDNGIGIASSHQQSIFKIFHQLDPEKSDGEGLGLNLVQHILGRLAGDIRVESEPGVGSRFYVQLPTILKTDTERRD